MPDGPSRETPSFTCVSCQRKHAWVREEMFTHWRCHACFASCASLIYLENLCSPWFVEELRATLLGQRALSDGHCPSCRQAMNLIPIRVGSQTVKLQGCADCRLVWFAPGEETRLYRSRGVVRPEMVNIVPAPLNMGARREKNREWWVLSYILAAIVLAFGIVLIHGGWQWLNSAR